MARNIMINGIPGIMFTQEDLRDSWVSDVGEYLARKTLNGLFLGDLIKRYFDSDAPPYGMVDRRIKRFGRIDYDGNIIGISTAVYPSNIFGGLPRNMYIAKLVKHVSGETYTSYITFYEPFNSQVTAAHIHINALYALMDHVIEVEDPEILVVGTPTPYTLLQTSDTHILKPLLNVVDSLYKLAEEREIDVIHVDTTPSRYLANHIVNRYQHEIELEEDEEIIYLDDHIIMRHILKDGYRSPILKIDDLRGVYFTYINLGDTITRLEFLRQSLNKAVANRLPYHRILHIADKLERSIGLDKLEYRDIRYYLRNLYRYILNRSSGPYVASKIRISFAKHYLSKGM